MIPLGLVVAGARAYGRLLLPILVLVFVAALSAGTLLAMKAHIAAANHASASLPVPPGSVLVAAAAPARSALLRAVHAQPIEDVDCVLLTVGTPQRAAEASVRLAQSTAPPRGILVRGRLPRQAGEAVLSRELLGALDVALGERLTCDQHRFSVVGEMVDPANRESRTAYVRVSAVPSGSATSWVLAPQDYFGLPDSAKDLVGITNDEATSKSLEGFGSTPGPPRLIAWLVLVAAVLSAATLGLLARRTYSRDVAVCVQLGASGTQLRRRIAAVFAASTALAGGSGAFLGQVATNALRGQLDAAWGQYWLDPAWSVGSILVVTALLGLGPIVALVVWRWASERPQAGTGAPGRGLLGLLFAGQVALGCYVWTQTAFYEAAPWLGNAALMAVVGGIAYILTPRSRDALDAVLREGMRGTVVLSWIVAVAVFAFAFSLARTDNQHARDVSLDLADAGQRPGALVLRNVPESVLGRLVSSYADLGGTPPASTREVDWSGPVPEVVTPLVAQCLAEDPAIDPTVPPARCLGPNDWFGNVFGVGAQVEGRKGSVPRAAREVVRRGMVGVVVSTPHGQVRTDQLRATADNDLGLNMPGLVLDSEALEELGGTPNDKVALYFGDFQTLTPNEQAQFRAVVMSAAPSAYPLQNDPHLDSVWGVERPRSQAIVYGLGLAGVAVLVLLLMLGFIASNAQLRTALVLHGASRRSRAGVALRILLVPLLTCLMAPVAARGTLWLMQRTATFDFSGVGAGWRWSTPGLLAAGVVIMSVPIFARTPSKDTR